MGGRARGGLLVLLALGMAGSAGLLAQALFARTAANPSRRPAMARQVDGGLMEQHLQSPDEKARILRWVETGASEGGWSAVKSVFEERCLMCHSFGAPHRVPLDQYASAAAVSQARPLLREKLEWGSMARYLEDPEERRALLGWIDRGAPEGEWEQIAAILTRRCLSCHNPQGVRGLVSLDRYARVVKIAVLPAEARAPLAVVLPAGTLLVTGILLGRVWRAGSRAA